MSIAIGGGSRGSPKRHDWEKKGAIYGAETATPNPVFQLEAFKSRLIPLSRWGPVEKSLWP